jgi:hypothetical protein
MNRWACQQSVKQNDIKFLGQIGSYTEINIESYRHVESRTDRKKLGKADGQTEEKLIDRQADRNSVNL